MNKLYIPKSKDPNRPLSDDEKRELEAYKAGEERRELERFQKIEREKYQPEKSPPESENSLTPKNLLIIIICTVVLGLWINSCSPDELGFNARAYQSKIETQECIAKGIAYYEGIGSYPRLSDGRKTENVVKGLCNISLDAFDGVKEIQQLLTK